MADKRIGQLLVERGVMSAEQVRQVLELQRKVRKPFGKLAVDLFGVAESEIWFAWAEQVGQFCPKVDLACEPNDAAVLKLLTPREAWLNHALPLRVDHGELRVATTITDLPEAAVLLRQRTDQPLGFVIADRRQLEQFIVKRYQIVAVEHEAEAV